MSEAMPIRTDPDEPSEEEDQQLRLPLDTGAVELASLPAGEDFYAEGEVCELAAEGEAQHWVDIIGEGEEVSGDRGLSLLVDLVRDGTVDPWDVDLEVVAERFMAEIDGLTVEDLPRSGRLFFFASVIIRIKAQYLAGRGAELVAPEPSEQDPWDDGDAMDWGWGEDDDEAASALSRRGPGEILLLPKRQIRKARPITIQDLLEALESSERHERKMEAARAKRAGKKQPVNPFKSVKEAMDTLHQDDLSADIAAAARLVHAAFLASDAVPLLDLTQELDKVSAFLALLFLAARGEVDLEQDSFYGPVRIRRPPEDRERVTIIPRERFVPKKREKKPEPGEGSAPAGDASAAGGAPHGAAPAPGEVPAPGAEVAPAPAAPREEPDAPEELQAARRALYIVSRDPGEGGDQ